MRLASQPQRRQRREKSIRIADAGQSMEGSTLAQRFGRTALIGFIQTMEVAGLQVHRKAWHDGWPIRRNHAIADHGIDGRQTRQGFAQGAERQAPAIADTAGVKHRQFDIAPQRVVLQAIVAHEYVDLRVLLEQSLPAARSLSDRMTSLWSGTPSITPTWHTPHSPRLQSYMGSQPASSST